MRYNLLGLGVKKQSISFYQDFLATSQTTKSSGEKRRAELRNMFPAGPEQGLEISSFTRGNRTGSENILVHTWQHEGVHTAYDSKTLALNPLLRLRGYREKVLLFSSSPPL